jgi:hypothetical protein
LLTPPRAAAAAANAGTDQPRCRSAHQRQIPAVAGRHPVPPPTTDRSQGRRTSLALISGLSPQTVARHQLAAQSEVCSPTIRECAASIRPGSMGRRLRPQDYRGRGRRRCWSSSSSRGARVIASAVGRPVAVADQPARRARNLDQALPKLFASNSQLPRRGPGHDDRFGQVAPCASASSRCSLQAKPAACTCP